MMEKDNPLYPNWAAHQLLQHAQSLEKMGLVDAANMRKQAAQALLGSKGNATRQPTR
jgi:hypothetical protein